ncbi:AAA family ATPase [Ketobacter sp.]|uniref:AAA family ATPase n=1 Tax=Ketobacter sp. TaxID=2083498 RepID=UPI000F2C7667|nr:AAA family ATPase [Ketobacter sp.]RLT99354.1 MAG: AAA family ATPase [Ketobacter sp.]
MAYEQAYNNETRDLVQLARKNKLIKPQFRDDVIGKVWDALQKRKSVLLVGVPGVGKSAIVHGLAHQLAQQKKMGLRELATQTVMRDTKYLGEWQTKAGVIFGSAKKEKSILYVLDIWNITSVGVSSSDPSNLFDFILQDLQSKRLVLLAEASPDVVDEMRKHPLLLNQFEEIQVEPLQAEQIRQLAQQAFDGSRFDIEAAACQRLLDLCDRFLPASQGPGPVLNFAHQVMDYCEQKADIGEHESISPQFVEKVFTIYTGLPAFVISRDETKSIREIRDWFRERVIGQDGAIEAVVETIALFKAGLQDPSRPLGAFLFVGPTGVGKTELAKALAVFLFGSASRLLRFDMSEFKDYYAFQMMLGDPGNPNKQARLLDPVRSQPFQVILFDEIEKGHPNAWDILLQLLDEGQVSPPKGPKVNFRNTIVIVTSNVGARDAQRPPMGFTQNGQGGSNISIESLETEFRPELLNRFQHIVSFHPLAPEQVKSIARKELRQILTREGITSRNLIVEVEDDVLQHVVDTGYDQRYGARALKRQIQQQVILPFATYLMEHAVEPGALLKMSLLHGRPRIQVKQTSQSVEFRQQNEPVTSGKGKRYRLADLKQGAQDMAAQLQRLREQVGEEHLIARLDELDQARQRADFWSDPVAAHRVILETDDIGGQLDRLAGLANRVADMRALLETDPGREVLVRSAEACERLQEQLATAQLEMVGLGSDQRWDALLELRPVGQSSPLQQTLFELYQGWAKQRRYEVKVLAEPMTESEPALLWVKGPYAYGYLCGEQGLHRFRDGEQHSVVRVSVAALNQEAGEERFMNHRALKQVGCYGGRIRSRLEVQDCRGLVLQNEDSLAENRETALAVASSWRLGAVAQDELVRRYDADPFLVRDYLTRSTVGKKDVLKPKRFHLLLERRIRERGALH